MLGPHRHGHTFRALASQCFGKCLVTTRHHIASGLRALVDIHVLDGFAATQRQTFVHDGLERQLFATAHLIVAGDDGHGTGVNHALLHRLGRETAKHHAVNSANAGASLHGDHALQRHGHVDQHAVALFHAIGLQGIGKLAHAGQ